MLAERGENADSLTFRRVAADVTLAFIARPLTRRAPKSPLATSLLSDAIVMRGNAENSRAHTNRSISIISFVSKLTRHELTFSVVYKMIFHFPKIDHKVRG